MHLVPTCLEMAGLETLVSRTEARVDTLLVTRVNTCTCGRVHRILWRPDKVLAQRKTAEVKYHGWLWNVDAAGEIETAEVSVRCLL